MKHYKLLFIIIIVLLYGCNKKNEPNSKQAIRDLEEKFPQLIEGKNVKDREFKLIKTVINGEDNFKVQFYSQKKELDNYHQIIILTNKRNRSFVLPLFNNKHRDYWSFANDKPIPNVKKINSTFENEFNSIFREIERERVVYKDSLQDINLINDVFVSAIQAQYFNYSHGCVESAKMRYAVSDIPVENEDSIRIRFEKNLEEIKKEITEINKYVYYYDLKGHRIYRLSYDFDEKKYKFRIYRQDCGRKKIEPMFL